MQKTLVIYAHPNKIGFCGKILSEVIEYLKKRNGDFEIIDLYAINYDPILKNDEHYTSGGYEISDKNKKFQKMIYEAKNIIVIYPTWWQGMPAILKGFFDRVFTSRFGFEYKNNIPIKLLKGRRAIVITTTGGPRWYTYFFVRDRSVKCLSKDILSFCGISTKSFVIGDARELNKEKVREIKKIVSKSLKFLQ